MKNSEPKSNQKRVKAYAIAAGETDTYDLKKREEKEALPDEDVKKHWDIRAQRSGVQAVMSARYTLEENIKATRKLQRDILKFLKGLIERKNIFELGVGIGRMTSELAKRAKTVVGVDLSFTMLEKAKQNLSAFSNVRLILGKITEIEQPPKVFDLVFDCIVLLHILNPQELRATIRKMQELSDQIFIVEHTYEGPDFPSSKYSILRKPEEYENLFKPYRLVKQKTHMCTGDTFTMMLFKNSAIKKE